MAEEKKKESKNVFQTLLGWANDLHQWLAEKLADEQIRNEILLDLGLDPTAAQVPPPAVEGSAQQQKIHELIGKEAANLDKEALAQTIAEIKALVTTLQVFAESVKTDGTDEWDVLWLVFKVWVADSLRVRNPSGYALCVILGMVLEEDEIIAQLDPAIVSKALRGEAGAAEADALVDRLSAAAAGVVVGLDRLVAPIGGTIDPMYGWDPEPGSDVEAVIVASRALSVAFDIGSPTMPMLTVIPVPRAHGGPGLMISMGAELELVHDVGSVQYATSIGANGAFALFFRFSWDDPDFQAFGPALPSVDIEVRPRPPQPGEEEPEEQKKPFLVFGSAAGSRLEIGSFSYGVEVGADHAGFKAHLRGGKLVIALSDGDGFLSKLPGGVVEVPFELGLLGDTSHGIRFDGGTGLKVDLPVAASLFGVFTVQSLALELSLGAEPVLEIRGGFSLQLGPFQASVDKIGTAIDLGAIAHGIDDVGDLVRFLPPKGIGLALEVGPLKGGGYLYIDPVKGEYAGALELKALTFSIKALALVTTKRPDGSDGWSLLVFVYAQFDIHIAFGIFWSGVAGMVGLHHRADLDALTAGMRTGALDDILFPENPVADAPRIINRYKQLFPVEPDSLLVGLMAEFSFSKPAIVYARIGFVFEVRNALGGQAPAELTRVILLGQVLVQLPPRDLGVPAIVKLLVDVVGFYDAPDKFLLIRARLRDSFVGIEGFAKLNLTGEMVLAMRFGDEPSFVLSAGGFHPAFKDVPRGVPDKLDRMAVSFGIGPLKLRNETYFAITSNSVQGGWKIELSADIEVASISGHLSFDALLFLRPRFCFVAELQFQVKLEAFGEDIASVRVVMTLQGPGEWRAKGHFSFSILWWDYEIGFDEHWGSAPAVTADAESAASTLLRELKNPDRMLPGQPIGGNALVTLAKTPPGLVLAHPLGLVTVAQKAVPMDVEIDRLGSTPITEVKATFGIESVIVGSSAAAAWSTVTDHFARGQFMELTEQQKLEGRSFETFTSGVVIGATDYRVPTGGVTVPADYEVQILEPEPELNLYFKVASRYLEALAPETAMALSGFGAAALSVRAASEQLHPGTVKVAIQEPPLVVVERLTLAEQVSVTAGPVSSEAIASKVAGTSGGLVVEAFEVVR